MDETCFDFLFVLFYFFFFQKKKHPRHACQYSRMTGTPSTREKALIIFVTQKIATRYGLLFNNSKNLHCDAKFLLVQRVY